MASLVQPTWKDVAIERSVVITDAWEITKIYAGRAAEWVLFVCMVLNIIEMLPGVTFWTWASNGIMATQIVTLDIAGFGLASMAEHAREIGEAQAASQATITARALITIMIITLLCVTIGVLFNFPAVKQWTGYAEDVLILVRVAMVVVYGHVIHKLRSVTANHPQVSAAGQAEEIEKVQRSLDQAVQSLSDLQAKSSQDAQELRDKIAILETTIATLQASSVDTQEQQKGNTPGNDDSNEDGNEDVNQESQIVDIADYQESNKPSTRRRQSVDTPGATAGGRGEARQKALRILKRQPQIAPVDLAKKANITRQYASKLISEQRKAVNE